MRGVRREAINPFVASATQRFGRVTWIIVDGSKIYAKTRHLWDFLNSWEARLVSNMDKYRI